MTTTAILIVFAIVLMVAMHTVSHGLRRMRKPQQPEATDGRTDAQEQAVNDSHGGHSRGCY